ncbi:MAG: hypothetical protein BGO66_10140 [Alicycliphilus sp. 69-12]|nr:MAG: hypothetical protein BGO66_10140 [Alicycliphilus sp. 69-12]
MQYPGKLHEHFMVPEPQYMPALVLQKLRAPLVMLHGTGLGMLPAIQLHHQPGLYTGKVRDIGADEVLAAEFVSVQLAATQMAP